MSESEYLISLNDEEYEWLECMFDPPNTVDIIQVAEAIIIKQKAGKIITVDEKNTLEKSLDILWVIYKDAEDGFYISYSLHILSNHNDEISPQEAESLIFGKNMEKKYLSKWINVKMALTKAVKDLAG
jgi:hypothetical protein